jgi:hypothetical protein
MLSERIEDAAREAPALGGAHQFIVVESQNFEGFVAVGKLAAHSRITERGTRRSGAGVQRRRRCLARIRPSHRRRGMWR